jgi:hypothetical protein
MSRKYPLAFMIVVTAALLLGFVSAGSNKESSAAEDKGAGSVLYVCNCGESCKCTTVSTKPGKCACGAELAATHVLKIENDEGILCTCGKDCTCKIDPNDPAKCGCGKAVKRVSLKGMYVCNCGSGCTCNTVSDEPGKCRCGADLKKL